MAISRMGDEVTAWWQTGRSAVSSCRCRLFMESDLFNEFDTEASERERKRLVERWNTRHELTCRNVRDDDPTTVHIDFVCSDCYCNFCFDGPINYCPNCGEKVGE